MTATKLISNQARLNATKNVIVYLLKGAIVNLQIIIIIKGKNLTVVKVANNSSAPCV